MDTESATESTPRSWAPEVNANGAWSRNALRFATEAEAAQSAKDLFQRWTLTTGHRATPADEPVNYRLVEGRLEPVTAPETPA